jgi:hypothetical protein
MAITVIEEGIPCELDFVVEPGVVYKDALDKTG